MAITNSVKFEPKNTKKVVVGNVAVGGHLKRMTRYENEGPVGCDKCMSCIPLAMSGGELRPRQPLFHGHPDQYGTRANIDYMLTYADCDIPGYSSDPADCPFGHPSGRNVVSFCTGGLASVYDYHQGGGESSLTYKVVIRVVPISVDHLDVAAETSDRFGIVACAALKSCQSTTDALDTTCEVRAGHDDVVNGTVSYDVDGNC